MSASKKQSFRLPLGVRADLQKAAELTGQTMTEFMCKALNRELEEFRNDNGRGKVQPIRAYRLTDVSEYEKRLAKLEGRAVGKGKHSCYVLDDETVNGKPFCKIYDCESGKIVKVHGNQVEYV